MIRSLRAANVPYLIFLLVAALLIFLSSVAGANEVRGGTAQSVRAGARGGGMAHNDDNANRVDADNGWDGRPVARSVALGTATAVTPTAIGSVMYSLPPACAMRPYGALTYYYCDNVWYEPRYSGSNVTYIVVPRPY